MCTNSDLESWTKGHEKKIYIKIIEEEKFVYTSKALKC